MVWPATPSQTSCRWQRRLRQSVRMFSSMGWPQSPSVDRARMPPGRLCRHHAQAGRLRIESGSSEYGDRSGDMQHTMRSIGRPGSPTVATNPSVVECALCSAHRPVAIRDVQPSANDNMCFDWQAPRSICTYFCSRPVRRANMYSFLVSDTKHLI